MLTPHRAIPNPDLFKRIPSSLRKSANSKGDKLQPEFSYDLVSIYFHILPCLTPFVRNNSSVNLPFTRNVKESFEYIDSINERTLPPNPIFSNFLNKRGLHTRSYA